MQNTLGSALLILAQRRRLASARLPALALAFLLAACGDGDGDGSGSSALTCDGGATSFRITPDWEPGAEGSERLVTIGSDGALDPRLSVFREGNYLRVIAVTADGFESEVALPIDGWTGGEQHAITITWGDGGLSLYADGEKVADTSYAGSLNLPPGTPLQIGSDDGPGTDPSIAGFRVFDRSLDETEIGVVEDPGPTLSADVVAAAGARTVDVCVHLAAGGAQVAGTQNDLVWDEGCASLRSCRPSGGHGKSLATSQPRGSSLHAIVLSLTDVAPIPDGPLYCCTFRTSLDAGCCPVRIEGALASDPMGRKLPVGEVSGSICAEDAAEVCG